MKQVGNTILAKGVNHILAKRDNPAWPKGSKLSGFSKAHQKAAALGYGTAVLLGHPDYYPRFGYRKAMDFGIEFPFDVPPEFCMVLELRPHALRGISGTIRYPDAFFE